MGVLRMDPTTPLCARTFCVGTLLNLYHNILTFLMVNKGIVYGYSENGPPRPLGVPGLFVFVYY